MEMGESGGIREIDEIGEDEFLVQVSGRTIYWMYKVIRAEKELLFNHDRILKNHEERIQRLEEGNRGINGAGSEKSAI